MVGNVDVHEPWHHQMLDTHTICGHAVVNISELRVAANSASDP